VNICYAVIVFLINPKHINYCMNVIWTISIVLPIGVVGGILLGFYWGALKTRLSLEKEIVALKMAQEKDQSHLEEKLSWVTQAEQTLRDTFSSLSVQALQQNNQQFLALAQSRFQELHIAAKGDLAQNQQNLTALLTPIKESLSKFDNTLQSVEKTRAGAYEGLTQQIKQLAEAERQLRQETHQLSSSLKSSQVRGRWGELQLKRVIEMAGMTNYCDFQEQCSIEGEEGARLRPDVVVRMSGGRQIVIDAKAPLSGFLKASEAADTETYTQHIKLHARQVRDHIVSLSRKAYWAQFQPSPEFVLLFLPGETFFSAALAADPELIEFGSKQQVILATPTTLIALLKTVAHGWQQQKIAEEARSISVLGRDLYNRLFTMGNYFGDMGKNLGKAVDSYNKGINALESRVMVSARKLHDMEAVGTDKEIPLLNPLEVIPINKQLETENQPSC
jgi:DNA recombination protein RmuC